LNYSQDHPALSLAGLYHDTEHPERQDLLIEKMIYSQPLLDLDEASTVEAARRSIFMDAIALEQLMEVALKDEALLSEAKAKRALSLLKTYIVRGLYNMTRILKGEFIEFLKQFDLLANFF